MRISIKIHGHQIFQHLEGDVLAWGQTVERFSDQHMQVPCVTLNVHGQVLTVPIKTERTWADIEVVAHAEGSQG